MSLEMEQEVILYDSFLAVHPLVKLGIYNSTKEKRRSIPGYLDHQS
jgi:hypothetical protein